MRKISVEMPVFLILPIFTVVLLGLAIFFAYKYEDCRSKQQAIEKYVPQKKQVVKFKHIECVQVKDYGWDT